MNGPQDMGGLQGFGPVIAEQDEPVFHAEWEKKALALTVAMGFGGMWNIDKSRHARERVGPANYITWSYYKIWIGALEMLLTEAGLATTEEIKSGKADEFDTSRSKTTCEVTAAKKLWFWLWFWLRHGPPFFWASS